MLNREIIAVCSEIHTKHINTLFGQHVEFVNVKLAVRKVTTGLSSWSFLCIVLVYQSRVWSTDNYFWIEAQITTSEFQRSINSEKYSGPLVRETAVVRSYMYVVGSISFRPDQLWKVTEMKQLCYFSI